MTRGTALTARLRAAIIVAAALLSPGLFQQIAQAQTTPPPKPEDFRAMQSPNGPASLTPVPGVTGPDASLITSPNGPAMPPPGFTGSKMVMTQAVWQQYVRYLQNDVSIGYGFFMITVDGLVGDVKQCKNYACQISPISQSTALSDCQAKARNRRCIIFAEGRSIKYAYQVLP